jgi:cytidine deaminase
MKPSALLTGLLVVTGCTQVPDRSDRWKLSESVPGDVSEVLARQIFLALDAAEGAGTDPPISRFHVRAATVAEFDGREYIVVGGNTEYHVPEAIHGETSLLNHVTSLYGPEATRRVRFIAFFTEGECGSSLSCGDCRDYQIAVTDDRNLLIACGQGSDHTVHIRKFSDAVVPEESFPEVLVEEIPLSAPDLQRLVRAAGNAREGGITLFTSGEHHAGAAGLSYRGNVYQAAGADDAAFHYRYPIGGLLQQAASQSDYFIEAIVVVGEPGDWPRISYRDRQYGYESSSFNLRRGREPIRLILTNGEGRYRMTTFEEALPYAFSTNAFMPEAVGEFLATHAQ